MKPKKNIPTTATERVVAGYIRLTREESRKTGLSAPAQRDDIARYVASASLGPLVIYEEDKAVAGDLAFEKRNAGRRLIADIASGRIIAVVARHLDRFVRSLRVWIDFLELCQKHGVQIHTVDGPVLLDSPANRYLTTSLVGMGVFEKEVDGDRGRRSKRELAKRGRPNGGPTSFGFGSQARLISECTAAGMPADEARRKAEETYPLSGTLYIDPTEAKVVRTIFRLYVDHRLGCRAICNELNRRGLRRRSGRPWCPDKVRRVINDPVVFGVMPYDDEFFIRGHGVRTPKHLQKFHPGQHEPIISEEVWRKAQEIKSHNTSRKKGAPAVANRRYALSGILQCGCGARMKAVSQRYDERGNLRFGYYGCYRRRDYGPEAAEGCSKPRVAIGRADAAFWSALSSMLASQELFDRVFDAARQLSENNVAECEPESPADRLRKIEALIVSWYERCDNAATAVESDVAYRRLVQLEEQAVGLRAAAEMPTAITTASPRSITKSQAEAFVRGLAGAMQGNLKREGAEIVRSLSDRHGLQVQLLDADRIRVALSLVPPNAEGAVTEQVVPVETIEQLPRNRIDQWLAENEGKCRCGVCGKAIVVVRKHFWVGLPRFHRNCSASQLSHNRSNPDPKTFLNGSQAAAELGISRTEFGRWMTAGRVTPVERRGNVLLFNRRGIVSLKKSIRKTQRRPR